MTEIPDEAAEKIRSMREHIDHLEAQLNEYVNGVADGLGVDLSGKAVDMEQGAFVEQDTEET